ncbi:MAG: tetratricopeptide repeat protein [Bacteroidales bacterium]|nr:tetratricopeptide repeat protein [Bacteroidales bacterium]
MRRIALLFLIVFTAAGCTRKAVMSTADTGKTIKADGRYDYLLTEALRQKYVGDVGEAARLLEKCIETDKTRSVPYFELAQIYSAAGLSDKSMNYASTAARLEPGNYWYQLAAGSLFTQYEQKDSALIYFTRALRADSRAVEVNTILAGLYAEKGEAEKADSLLRVIGAEGEMGDDMFLMMISGLIMNGDLDEAARRTQKLIEREPSEIRYKALLADIYLEDGKQEKSDSIYKDIIAKDPENIETQLLYMMNLVYKKEYSGIESFLKNVFESELVERQRKVAVAGRLLSDTAYVKENSSSLAESLIILEGQYRDDEEILSMRPSMYETAGREDEAIARYEELLKTVKPGFYFSERLILLYAGKREYRKLYDLATVYSRENNRSILGKVYYAIAAMELKEYEVADSELKKALILAGNNDELKVQVLTIMGDLKYRMKDFDAAYAFYEEALQISPDETMVLNNYAYFLAEGDRDLKKALKMAERVMQKEGDNETYIDTYAWVLYKLGRHRDAHKAMMRIFDKEGERDPEILEHMGYIVKALDRCHEAVAFWRSALEKDGAKTYLEEEISKCGNY